MDLEHALRKHLPSRLNTQDRRNPGNLIAVFHNLPSFRYHFEQFSLRSIQVSRLKFQGDKWTKTIDFLVTLRALPSVNLTQGLEYVREMMFNDLRQTLNHV